MDQSEKAFWQSPGASKQQKVTERVEAIMRNQQKGSWSIGELRCRFNGDYIPSRTLIQGALDELSAIPVKDTGHRQRVQRWRLPCAVQLLLNQWEVPRPLDDVIDRAIVRAGGLLCLARMGPER